VFHSKVKYRLRFYRDALQNPPNWAGFFVTQNCGINIPRNDFQRYRVSRLLSRKPFDIKTRHGIEIEDVASMAHILVVDDDPSINDLNALTLKREGHDVRQAHDGRAAVKMALESAPDLILLDVMMPVMSGYDIARALYGSSVTRQIPILFFSASAKPDNLEDKRLMPPILGYLSKPCDIHVLVDRVRNALNSL
jgi:CheY-like chemotaxis protein